MNEYYRPRFPYQRSQTRDEKSDNTIELKKYITSLWQQRSLIISIAVVIAALGTAYAFMATPRYEANILVQIDANNPQPRNILTDLTAVADNRNGAATETEVLRSRNVLSRVVDNTMSYITVQPKRFPVIGPWLASHNKNLSVPGLAGYGLFNGYVWGAEQASISLFNLPEGLEGKKFILTAVDPQHYRMQQLDQDIEFTGKFNETVTAPTSQGTIEIRVESVHANPGAQFLVTRISKIEAVEHLQKSLKIMEKGKQTGIISVRLIGTEPKVVSTIVNEVGKEYIRQTVDHRAEEAEKSLIFLNKQLPVLKQELENAEVRYNAIRNANSTIDLNEESKSVVQQTASLQTKIVELRQKRQELQSRFVDGHPAIESVNGQINDINRQLALVNSKVKKMPAVEQDVLRATRDLKVSTDLYTNLLSTAQQLRQVSASQLSSTRLLDTAAIPKVPVGPDRLAVISFAALFGLILGALIATLKQKLKGKVPDPFMLESLLGMPVTATIPHSPRQKALYAQMKSRTKKLSVLPSIAPEDQAVEGLRGFRTVLQSGMVRSRNNIILITGPTAAVGKSFVSANMANVLASIDRKVLLIDADMRNGYLHRYFGLERENGLSELITAQTVADDAIHKNVVENVDFISTGVFPAKPAELLAHKNFGILLQSIVSRYDFIIIDTAPVLAFSDAMVVAKHAGAIYNVVRDGISTVNEIEDAVRRLRQAGGDVTGTIFNDMKGKSAYGYGYA
ncbi:polysaccharide biosynthesis tyrosine autokinase [Noviherbaspirillum saxi]|nr:polysaccharide biosynthesis tyrosine autokinase [Noviherbaspirillum saxi]